MPGIQWTLLFNILINGYPIMLQRYNRIKLLEFICQQDGCGVTP
jgi:Glycosyl-4,4'-diaponeurosporenoate acyltransferase